MIEIIIISILITIILSVIVGVILRFLNFSIRQKKRLFALISAFLTFPAMTYGGDVFILPLPHVLSIYAMRYELFWEAYINAWIFDLPSFLITLLLFRGIAAIIYKKTLPTPENKLI